MYARPRKPCMTLFDLRAHCIASLESSAVENALR